MADNVNAGSNDGLGPKFKTDDDGTSHWPYAKLAWGADNTQTRVAAGAGALPIQDGGNSITVDGTVGVSGTVTVDGSAVTQPVSHAALTELAAAINASSQMDVNIAASGATVPVSNAGLTALNGAIAGTEVQVDVVAALPTGTNNIGDVDVLTVPAPLSTTGGGTEATALRVTLASDSTGVVSVDDNGGSLTVDAPVGTPVFVRLSDGSAAIATLPVSLATVPSHAVTNAGTFATQVDGAALTALQLIDDSIFADDAAFTVGTSKVNVGGGITVAHGASPDAADAGDAAAPLLNRHRIPFGIGGHPNQKSATYLWTGATTDDNVLAAIAGGTKYAITRITITLDEATTVGVACRLGFGTANVPALPAANGDAVDDILFYHPGMVPGSMHTVGDGSSILGVGGDGSELRITAEATTSGTGVVTVSYFTIES